MTTPTPLQRLNTTPDEIRAALARTNTTVKTETRTAEQILRAKAWEVAKRKREAGR